MLQPFEPLLPMYLLRFEKMQTAERKFYFVTQYYPRGINHFEEEERVPILVSVYEDPGLAKTHLNAIKADKYKSVMHLDNKEHHTQLWSMVRGQTKYVMFWAVVKDAKELEKRVTLKYKDHMKRYIDQHTNWRISKETTVRPSLELTFGELYINMRHGSQHLRIKFEDIEKPLL
jgi:hypothetical protein